MIRSIERRCSEVKELIRDQEKAEVSRAEGLLEQLEQEIAELRRRDAELEQLSHTEDHIHFLQSSKSLCVPPGPGDLPSITVSPYVSFEAVRKCVSELKERLEDVCKGEMSKISRAGRAVGVHGCFTEVETCPLCMEPFQKKQRLMCTHAICAACLERSVERLGLQCPVCQQALRVLGDQPEGQMTHSRCSSHYIFIRYNIPDGIQTEAHPNPGKPFTGLHTESYLPESPEGRKVMKLLQRAFEQKLIFTVAATHGAADRVTITDIPHDASGVKCKQPGFLQRVKAALRAKGIE
ncbi:hypothetical protein COCON_G00233950 [Conger conger]|uniref:E3 ubiquitin-protein ligase n=1 Tax=Conger conger TaxID=82655 RepID=A0A9Q1HLI2_CONCO|nr:hypothetical protein COCON_G00233950 [Conger conger]